MKPGEKNATNRLQNEQREKVIEEFSEVILKSFFDHYGIVSQNIHSFNRFIEFSLPKIITTKPLVVTNADGNVRYEMHVTKVEVTKPTSDEHEEDSKVLLPNECRLRQMSYLSEILIWGYYRVFSKRVGETEIQWEEIVPEKKGKNQYQEIKRFCIGRIPAMVKSVVCHLATMSEEDMFRAKECPLDPGGYFILKGKEKVLLSREKLPENQLMVFETLKQEQWISQCEIRGRADEVSDLVRATWVRYSCKTKRGIFAKEADDDEEGESEEEDNASSWKSLNSMIQGQLQTWFKELKNRNHFYVVGPRTTSVQVPLCVFMIALGVTSAEFAEDWIIQGETGETATKMREMLEPTLEFWNQQDIDQELAIKIIGFLNMTKRDEQSKTPYEWGRGFLNSIFLPHIGTEPENDGAKAVFLAHMVRSICECQLGLRAYDDRDHLKSKRLDLPGSMCSELFSRSWSQIQDHMVKSLRKRKKRTKHLNPIELISEFTVTQRFEYIIRTGNLGHNTGFGTGISQELSRTCRVSTLAALRRVMTLSSSRNLAARYVHHTCSGMICPYESPEGPQIGLVKNLALSARVTVGCSPDAVEAALLSQETMTVLDPTNFEVNRYLEGSIKVFLNGKWLGSLAQGVDVRRLKREITSVQGVTPAEVSFEFIKKRIPELHIRCDAGRLIRPLYVCTGRKYEKIPKVILKAAKGELRWPDLVSKGCVEELDTAELTGMYVSSSTSFRDVTVEHTHREIHPHLVMGLCASTVPFANHNQAVRNCYQSNMAKQSIGMYSTSYQHRNDKIAHILAYSHQPLMSTLGANVTKVWELPAGVECVVAIASWSGYNQEDSVIFSKSAIDRGLFRSSAVHSFSSIQEESCSRFDTKAQVFKKPAGMDAPHMDDDGLPWSGEKVAPDRAIIGKNIVEAAKEPLNASVMLSTVGPVTVQRSYATTREDGAGLHSVQVEEVRIPKIGDKFSSRHGQKGVIGMVYNQEDLPFNKHGMTPDIILNPHAIPSRQTIGHLVEALAGKARCARRGRLCIKSGEKTCRCPKQPLFTGTTHSNCLTRESMEEILNDNGYHSSGDEMLFDPYTGKKFAATVFMGVNYYQRLRHMVVDKISVRREGDVDPLTGQPQKGGARDAAQRLGEMERDCIIAHGCPALFNERFFQQSDGIDVKVCTSCGAVAEPVAMLSTTSTLEGKEIKEYGPKYTCIPCMRTGNPRIQLATVRMPKATKLLIQELACMGIRTKLRTKGVVA